MAKEGGTILSANIIFCKIIWSILRN